MTEQENRDESVNMNGGSYSKAVINDKSRAFILSTLVALNLLGTVWMFVQWKIAERETRLLEYYVMELDGKMMASGLLQPPDSWSGKHKGK